MPEIFTPDAHGTKNGSVKRRQKIVSIYRADFWRVCHGPKTRQPGTRRWRVIGPTEATQLSQLSVERNTTIQTTSIKSIAGELQLAICYILYTRDENLFRTVQQHNGLPCNDSSIGEFYRKICVTRYYRHYQLFIRQERGREKRKGNKEGIRSHKTLGLYFSYLWCGHPWADSRKSYRAYCAPYDLMKISNFVITFSEVSDVKSQFSHWLCYDGCDQTSTVNVFVSSVGVVALHVWMDRCGVASICMFVSGMM